MKKTYSRTPSGSHARPGGRRLPILIICFVGMTVVGRAQSAVPGYGDGKAGSPVKERAVVQVRAYPFSIKDVRLLDGPFKRAMEADAAYLLSIEPDRLLCDFRVHAGLEPKAKKYGGWESLGLAGHTLGHYLSACSMAYASTGDARFLDKVNYIVDELLVCQEARSRRHVPGLVRMTGYVGAIPGEDSLWTEVSAGIIRSHGFDLNGGWSPWYTVHKVMAGLLDAYLYCGNMKALGVELGMADWTGTIVGHLSDPAIQRMLTCEYGGMNDVLANTYALTGEKKYLDLSYKFYDHRILDSLSRGLDDLAGKHSNTQIPKVIGCARRYELTGDERDKRIAESFWKIVVDKHSYATGGNSDYEYLGQAGKLNDELTDNTTETCVTYNMLKLTRHLFALEPSAGLMDYYEKALYNHILASQNHETGMMCYFMPLRMGGRKEYSDPFNTFTCCVGSGMENHVKYGESIYWRGEDGSLYVNLFIPSRLSWREKGVEIELQSALPGDGSVVLTVSGSARFAMRVRVPNWAGNWTAVMVNNAPVKVVVDGGYLVIDREWKNGDRLQVVFNESFYTEAIPDNPSRVAVFYGPVLLAGELGMTEPNPVKGIPVLVSDSADPGYWVKRVTGPGGVGGTAGGAAGRGGSRDGAAGGPGGLVFETKGVGKPEDVRLIPLNEIGNEYYSVYWDLFTPAAWAKEEEKYAAERRREQEQEERTVDRLRLGEMQPERDHDLKGDNLRSGEGHGKKWRAADDGGGFSFRMKVDPAAVNSIVCTYWGDDHRGRNFDIQVDGKTIATQNLDGLKQSKFYEFSYRVPQELVKGKSSVRVGFVAHGGHAGVGPVSGVIRMVRG